LRQNQSSVKKKRLGRDISRCFLVSKIKKTDVLIIGGGSGGAAMAVFLLRQGIKPVILEQEVFPRYHCHKF
jgi:ribulose 1,5-bisphosphate synthetase/thiazole synthase